MATSRPSPPRACEAPDRMRARTLLIASLLGAARPATAQEALPARGHLMGAGDAVMFAPCGAAAPYALSTSGEIGRELANAVEVFGGGGRRRVFVEMEGWMDAGPIERAVAAYEGTWTAIRVDSVGPEAASDCSGEPPPVWLRSGCEPLTAPDLDCLPADLVEADRRLARYVTEALRLTEDSGDLAAAHAAWKRNRDIRCSATRPGGTVDLLWVLSCRRGMSRARLQSVWDEHLRGTTTELTDPRIAR